MGRAGRFRMHRRAAVALVLGCALTAAPLNAAQAPDDNRGLTETLLDCAAAYTVFSNLERNKGRNDDTIWQAYAFVMAAQQLSGERYDVKTELTPRGKRFMTMKPNETEDLLVTCHVFMNVGMMYHRLDRR